MPSPLTMPRSLSTPDDFGRFSLLNEGERRVPKGVLDDVAVGVTTLVSAQAFGSSDDVLLGPPTEG